MAVSTSETPGVVLVHGIRASRSMWLAQLTALGAAGVPAVAPDLPGHGGRRDEPFSVAGALDAIEDAAGTLAGPLVVAGLSLGGYLAVHWAAHGRRRPDAVLAASCSTQPQGAGLAAYTRLARLIGRLPDGGAGLSDVLARRVLPARALEDLAVGGMSVAVMDNALAGMAGVDTLADLGAIDAPVWLVNGQWDHFRTQERRFLRACDDGRLLIVPRATHLVSLVAPVAFNRILLELVEHVRTAPARQPEDTRLSARAAPTRARRR